MPGGRPLCVQAKCVGAICVGARRLQAMRFRRRESAKCGAAGCFQESGGPGRAPRRREPACGQRLYACQRARASPRVRESASPRVRESASPRVRESASPRVRESASPKLITGTGLSTAKNRTRHECTEPSWAPPAFVCQPFVCQVFAAPTCRFPALFRPVFVSACVCFGLRLFSFAGPHCFYRRAFRHGHVIPVTFRRKTNSPGGACQLRKNPWKNPQCCRPDMAPDMAATGLCT